MVVRNLILVLFTTSHQIKEVTLEKPVSDLLVVAARLPPTQGAEVKWGVLAPAGKITRSGFLLMLLSLPPPSDEELLRRGQHISTSGR